MTLKKETKFHSISIIMTRKHEHSYITSTDFLNDMLTRISTDKSYNFKCKNKKSLELSLQ